MGRVADVVTTLDYILLGIVVGAVGQGARAAVGIKKARQDAPPEKLRDGTWWDRRRFLTSFLVGGIAGALYVVVRFDTLVEAEANVTRGLLMTLLGVGYAGTDFIEGVLRDQLSADDGGGFDEPLPDGNGGEGDGGGRGGGGSGGDVDVDVDVDTPDGA